MVAHDAHPIRWLHGSRNRRDETEGSRVLGSITRVGKQTVVRGPCEVLSYSLHSQKALVYFLFMNLLRSCIERPRATQAGFSVNAFFVAFAASASEASTTSAKESDLSMSESMGARLEAVVAFALLLD